MRSLFEELWLPDLSRLLLVGTLSSLLNLVVDLDFVRTIDVTLLVESDVLSEAAVSRSNYAFHALDLLVEDHRQLIVEVLQVCILDQCWLLPNLLCLSSPQVL